MFTNNLKGRYSILLFFSSLFILISFILRLIFAIWVKGDFDWNIGEYRDTDLFAVFDNNDILQMIQTLTSGLKISCKPWWEE